VRVCIVANHFSIVVY